MQSNPAFRKQKAILLSESNPTFRKQESSALKVCFIYIEAPVSDSSSQTSKVDKERELNILREKESNPAFLLSESRKVVP